MASETLKNKPVEALASLSLLLPDKPPRQMLLEQLQSLYFLEPGAQLANWEVTNCGATTTAFVARLTLNLARPRSQADTPSLINVTINGLPAHSKNSARDIVAAFTLKFIDHLKGSASTVRDLVVDIPVTTLERIRSLSRAEGCTERCSEQVSPRFLTCLPDNEKCESARDASDCAVIAPMHSEPRKEHTQVSLAPLAALIRQLRSTDPSKNDSVVFNSLIQAQKWGRDCFELVSEEVTGNGNGIMYRCKLRVGKNSAPLTVHGPVSRSKKEAQKGVCQLFLNLCESGALDTSGLPDIARWTDASATSPGISTPVAQNSTADTQVHQPSVGSQSAFTRAEDGSHNSSNDAATLTVASNCPKEDSVSGNGAVVNEGSNSECSRVLLKDIVGRLLKQGKAPLIVIHETLQKLPQQRNKIWSREVAKESRGDSFVATWAIGQPSAEAQGQIRVSGIPGSSKKLAHQHVAEKLIDMVMRGDLVLDNQYVLRLHGTSTNVPRLAGECAAAGGSGALARRTMEPEASSFLGNDLSDVSAQTSVYFPTRGFFASSQTEELTNSIDSATETAAKSFETCTGTSREPQAQLDRVCSSDGFYDRTFRSRLTFERKRVRLGTRVAVKTGLKRRKPLPRHPHSSHSLPSSLAPGAAPPSDFSDRLAS